MLPTVTLTCATNVAQTSREQLGTSRNVYTVSRRHSISVKPRLVTLEKKNARLRYCQAPIRPHPSEFEAVNDMKQNKKDANETSNRVNEVCDVRPAAV